MIHQFITKTILNLPIIIKKFDYNNNDLIFQKKQLFICYDDYNPDILFCDLSTEELFPFLSEKFQTEVHDAYGSYIINNDILLLNNYDCINYEYQSPNGFCNILGFATLSKDGIINFTQIIYNFKYKKLIIRDNVSKKLPLENINFRDFGGKRATYRYGSILSIRTSLDIYKQVPDIYKQSDKLKNTLSYPRLLIQL